MIHSLKKKLFTFCFLLFACYSTSCSKKKSDQSTDTESVKFQQYYLQGKNLYITHCSNCHQESGTGLGLVYPPLNKSDFMNNHFDEVICLIRYGRHGEIIVNGKSYIQGMPAIPSLTDLEIAEVSTYIYNTWEHSKGMIEVKEVSTILSACESK